MSQKNVVLSQAKDLLYFQGLDLSAGITTAIFAPPDQDEYVSPEEHLLTLLEGVQFIKSDPKRAAKIITIKPDESRNYYTEDVLICPEQNRNFNPVLIMRADDEPVVILSYPKRGLLVVLNGSWENIIINLVHSTVSAVRAKFDINIAEMSAWIWPGLCHDCFRPGKDLFDYLTAENKKIDLRNNLLRQLTEQGIKDSNIHSTHLCSSHSKGDQGYFLNSPQRENNEESGNLLFAKLNF